MLLLIAYSDLVTKLACSFFSGCQVCMTFHIHSFCKTKVTDFDYSTRMKKTFLE